MNTPLFNLTVATALLALASTAGCGTGEEPVVDGPEAAASVAAGEVERLAADSDPHSLYLVANKYATGDGIDEDQDIAERLWRVACDKGHAYACSNFGSRQLGREKFALAEEYLKKAAEGGVSEAIRNLIELYDNPGWAGASVDESVRWQDILTALDNLGPAQSPAPVADPDAGSTDEHF